MKKTFILAVPVLVVASIWIASTYTPAELADGVTIRPTRTTGLFIEARPAGASIKLNGKPLGKSDTLLVVPPGKCQITVTLDGHLEKEQPIEIRGGRITRIVIELEREPELELGPDLPEVLQAPALPSEEPLPVAVLTDHEDYVLSMAFSPDGRFIASAGNYDTVRVWDVATRKVRHLLDVSDFESHVKGIAFSRNVKTLAACGGRDVRCWDVDTGKVQRSSAALGYTRCLAFLPDGETLAVGSHDSVLICEAGSLRQRSILETAPRMAVWRLSYSPDGKLIAAAGGDYNKEAPVMLWDVATGRRVASGLVGRGRNYGLAISPDGETLATRGTNGILVLCELDGLGTAPKDNGAERMPSPARPWKVLPEHYGAVRDVTFSPDGNLLACAGGGDVGRVTIWDTHPASVLTAFETPEGQASCVAFSSDGKLMAYTAKNVVKLIKVSELSERRPGEREQPAAAVAQENGFRVDRARIATPEWQQMIALSKELPTIRLGNGQMTLMRVLLEDGDPDTLIQMKGSTLVCPERDGSGGGGDCRQMRSGDFVLVDHSGKARQPGSKEPVEIATLTHYRTTIQVPAPPRGKLEILGDVILSPFPQEKMGRIVATATSGTQQQLKISRLCLGPLVVGGLYGKTWPFGLDHPFDSERITPGSYEIYLPDFDRKTSRWTVTVSPAAVTRLRFLAHSQQEIEKIEEPLRFPGEVDAPAQIFEDAQPHDGRPDAQMSQESESPASRVSPPAEVRDSPGHYVPTDFQKNSV